MHLVSSWVFSELLPTVNFSFVLQSDAVFFAAHVVVSFLYSPSAHSVHFVSSWVFSLFLPGTNFSDVPHAVATFLAAHAVAVFLYLMGEPRQAAHMLNAGKRAQAGRDA